jgi:hypothetical protein
MPGAQSTPSPPTAGDLGDPRSLRAAEWLVSDLLPGILPRLSWIQRAGFALHIVGSGTAPAGGRLAELAAADPRRVTLHGSLPDDEVRCQSGQEHGEMLARG